jgi:lysozyme
MYPSTKIKIQNQLKFDEGVKNKPYKDTEGILTIGVGRNLESVGISKEEIEFMLSNDIDRCEKDLRLYFAWYDEKKENVQMVLINMCFNMGIYRLLKFVKTLELIQFDKLNEAAEEMLKSKWAIQVGDRAIRLSKLLKNE